MWVALSRVILLMNLAYTARSLQQQQGMKSIININRIYNTRETARLLEMERTEIIGLLKDGSLKGRLVKGNYRITGKSIEDYLHNEI